MDLSVTLLILYECYRVSPRPIKLHLKNISILHLILFTYLWLLKMACYLPIAEGFGLDLYEYIINRILNIYVQRKNIYRINF